MKPAFHSRVKRVGGERNRAGDGAIYATVPGVLPVGDALLAPGTGRKLPLPSQGIHSRD